MCFLKPDSFIGSPRTNWRNLKLIKQSIYYWSQVKYGSAGLGLTELLQDIRQPEP